MSLLLDVSSYSSAAKKRRSGHQFDMSDATKRTYSIDALREP
jgi:hypothetical protein